MSRASETTAEVTPPSSSRPDSGHPHLQERRDSYEAVSAAAAASSEVIKTNPSSLSDKGNAQYVAENQCLVKYYDGDAAIAVEEHFNRTLKETNEQQETSTPMNQRNLPPSFWQLPQTNVNGSNNSSSTTTTSVASTASWASEFYNDQLQQAAALHQLAADWPYTAAGHSAAQSGYVNRSASHPYNYIRPMRRQPWPKERRPRPIIMVQLACIMPPLVIF